MDMTVARFIMGIFMPWRLPGSRLVRSAAWLSTIVMLLAISVFFTDATIKPLTILTPIFVLLIVLVMIQETIALKRVRARMTTLHYAQAVNLGLIRIEDLPANIQDDVKIEYARFKLKD